MATETVKISAANKMRRLSSGLLTDRELQAAFLTARGYGKILEDDVLVAIVKAVLDTEK